MAASGSVVLIAVAKAAIVPIVALGDDGAGRRLGDPVGDVGPRQRGEVDGLFGLDRRRSRGGRQVDVDVPEAGPADGERDGQLNGLVVLAEQGGQPPRDMHVGRGEHAGVVERREQSGRADRPAGVEAVDLLRGLGHACAP